MNNFDKTEFLALIWPVAYKYNKEIISSLKIHFHIKSIHTVSFNNCLQFEEFMNKVYSVDRIDPWKINKKIELCKEHTLTCTVISFYSDETEFYIRVIDGKIKYLPKKVKDIKEMIRDKYKNNISNYFYDVIIHMTDDGEETVEILDILKNYETEVNI